MDRHKLEQVNNQIDELVRHGSSSCMRQARSLMGENFHQIVSFALRLSEPPPKPKHTIADKYPAGGLTSTEPCMFCKDFEKLREAHDGLVEDNLKLRKCRGEVIECGECGKCFVALPSFGPPFKHMPCPYCEEQALAGEPK